MGGGVYLHVLGAPLAELLGLCLDPPQQLHLLRDCVQGLLDVPDTRRDGVLEQG